MVIFGIFRPTESGPNPPPLQLLSPIYSTGGDGAELWRQGLPQRPGERHPIMRVSLGHHFPSILEY